MNTRCLHIFNSRKIAMILLSFFMMAGATLQFLEIAEPFKNVPVYTPIISAEFENIEDFRNKLGMDEIERLLKNRYEGFQQLAGPERDNRREQMVFLFTFLSGTVRSVLRVQPESQILHFSRPIPMETRLPVSNILSFTNNCSNLLHIFQKLPPPLNRSDTVQV